MARFRLQDGAVAFLSGAIALHPIVTPDVWWHLAAGRWIVEHRAVPRSDVFSYTMQSHEWTNLQWLTDVLLFAGWTWAGPDGLVLFKALALALTWVLLAAAARAAGAGGGAATAAVVLAILASAERTFVRPEIFTGLGLTATLTLIHRARAGHGRALLAIPPLTLLWANLHSLAFLGPATVLLHALLAGLDARLPMRFRDRRVPARLGRRLALCGVVSAAALLVNPYGIRAWTFPFTLLRRIEGSVEVFSRILEFGRPLATPEDPALRFAWILMGVVALSFLALAPRLSLSRLASIAPFLALAFLARRNLPLFAIAAVPVLARNLTELGSRFPTRLSLRGATWAVPLAAMALAGVVLAGASPRLLGLWRDRGLAVAPDLAPEECLAALDETGIAGNLFHDLDFGGYAVWRNPERKSFIDGRLEVAGPDWFARFVAAHEDPRAWERMRTSWKLDVLLLEHSAPGSAAFLRSLLASAEWSPLAFSPEAALLVETPLAGDRRAILDPDDEDYERLLAQDAGPAPGAGRSLAFVTRPLHRWLTRDPPLVAVRRAARLANLCLTLDQVPPARAGYRKVLEVEPDDPEALFNLGMCDLREGNVDRARALWESGLPRVPRGSRGPFRAALERWKSPGPPPATPSAP